MGWWNVGRDIELGDGPLDLADEFLGRLAQEYVDDLGRKPRLVEILRTLEAILQRRADEFVQDGEQFLVSEISAKTKRRPKKQPFRVGDVFAVPLSGGMLALGQLTPQRSFAEFFCLKIKKLPSAETLRATERIRLPLLIDLEPLEAWRWKVVTHLPYDRTTFVPQHFLIGGQATCGDEERSGFVDVSSRLCPAAPGDFQHLPKMSIANEAYLVAELERRLT